MYAEGAQLEALLAASAVTLAGELRAAKARLAIGNDEIAARSGLSESTIKRFSNGAREPRVPDLIKLATALNADPGELLDVALAKARENVARAESESDRRA